MVFLRENDKSLRTFVVVLGVQFFTKHHSSIRVRKVSIETAINIEQLKHMQMSIKYYLYILIKWLCFQNTKL